MVLLLAAGLAAGLLLAVTQLVPRLVPLQLVALAGWFAALIHLQPGWAMATASGALLGGVPALSLAVSLSLPVAMFLPVLAVIATSYALAAGAGALLPGHASFPGLLASAGLLMLADQLQQRLMPFFGTAQSLVRNWSTWPQLIQCEAWIGTSGLLLAEAVLAAAAAWAMSQPEHCGAALGVCAGGLAIVACAWVRWRPRAGAPVLRVAAAGCATSDYSEWSDDLIASFVGPMAERAAAGGARLLVFPEGLLSGRSDAEVEREVERIAVLARQQRLAIAIGAILPERNENHLRLIDGEGRMLASYAKHHLVPMIESWRPGTGAPIGRLLLGTLIGGMICQDDNFTDVSRANGRLGVAVMSVPTADWAEVRHVHLQNAIHRAIETRYGVVRGSSNGISAIIAPGGAVLASWDHCQRGMGMVVADLPLAPARSLHSRLGEWPALLAAALLAIGGLLAS